MQGSHTFSFETLHVHPGPQAHVGHVQRGLPHGSVLSAMVDECWLLMVKSTLGTLITNLMKSIKIIYWIHSDVAQSNYLCQKGDKV